MAFLEQITQAYKEQKDFDEDQAQSSKRRIEARVKEGLAELGVTDPFVPDGQQAQFGGITIRAVVHNDYYLDWQVQGSCPDCEEMCWSRHVVTLAGIGRMHHAFNPDFDHHCTPQATVTEREV